MVNLRRNLLFIALAAFIAGIMFMSGCLVVNDLKPLAGNKSGVAVSNFADASGTPPGVNADAVAEIVSNAGPAVVKIDTVTVRGQQYDPFFNDPFFRQFFGSPFGSTEPQEEHGLGSGFIISSDGYILTNEHVIEGADKITATIQGFKDPLQASVVGADYDLDLAVLKVKAGSSLSPLKLGDSNKIRVGNWVIAIGNPYGLDHTVTAGVISAKGRPINVENRSYKNLLQTDASINPGNSGGPLLNLSGQVIGINTAVAQAQGIGFAIPANTANDVIQELINKGKVVRPWLGVQVQSIDEEISADLNYKGTKGALVAGILSGSPAAAAGLKQGDIITKWDGKEVVSPDALVELIGKSKIGQSVPVTIYREGKPRTIQIMVTEKPGNI